MSHPSHRCNNCNSIRSRVYLWLYSGERGADSYSSCAPFTL
jgi:hypothetical protein